MVNKYYITRKQPKANHAGSKAVLDTEIILEKSGYNRINIFPYRKGFAPLRKAGNVLSLLNINSIKDNSLVVVEHPLYINSLYMQRLKKIKAKSNVKIAFLIHDFETLRNLFPDNEMMRIVDKEMVGVADYLIVHNKKMKEYFMAEYGFKSEQLIELGVFDYICEGENSIADRSKEDGVTVAGNLNPTKSGYVYKLQALASQTTFNLFGVNFDQTLSSDSVKYFGSKDADELPNCLSGKFGLIWDGSSVECCEGATGEYIKYNNPHKVSLYIAAGLPIIIWSKAALADFVTENNIGFTIDNLEEIPGKIAALSDEDYELFANNMKLLSKKVRTGEFLENALKELERRN